MKYIRSRPWRSRGPWFSNRAGARRRGFRDDEVLSVAHEVFPEDDVAIAGASDAIRGEDVVLPDADSRSIPESMLVARVDLSGLLAIAAPAPEPPPIALGEDTFVALDWLTHASRGGDDSSITRHSA